MSLNKNNISIYFLIFFLQQALAQQSYEQENDSILPQDLDEVVVTATRTLRQLSSLPLPVTLISKAQIQQTGVTRLDEILNEQTGIIMTPDATIGGGEGVQIQGISSDYVLVLIDGVPVVGRSSGNLDLSRLAVGNIKQVEIVKGPSSSLFGSEALGGVINIITEKPTSDRISGQISHRFASFNNQNTNISLEQRLDKVGYSLFFDRLSTDGYDLTPNAAGQTVNPFENYTLNTRLYLDITQALDAFVSGRYFTQEFQLEADMSGEEDANVQIQINHQASEKASFQYEFYYTNYKTDERISDPIDDELFIENNFDQQLLRPEIRFNYVFKPNSTLTAGAGSNFESLDRSLFAERVSFNSQYLFTQYDFKPIEKLNLILGARFDNHSVYNSQLSPKVSAKYDINPEFSLKASVGSGFKAPDFRQLYLDFSNVAGGGYSVFGKEVELAGIQRLQANDEIASLQVELSDLGEPLEAESSVGYNFGLVYRQNKLSSELNLFRNDFRNLIDTRILAAKTNGQNVFGYINRERVYTQGIELDLKYKLLANLDVSAGYQLLYAYDKDKLQAIDNGEVFARDPETLETIRITREDYFGLENRSRHTVNFKAFYEIPKWNSYANLRLTYRSKFGLTDSNGNDVLDTYDNSFVEGYGLVNLALGKTFFKHYQIQIGANNLLNFQGTNPLGAADTNTLINPGIQLFTKINIQF